MKLYVQINCIYDCWCILGHDDVRAFSNSYGIYSNDSLSSSPLHNCNTRQEKGVIL